MQLTFASGAAAARRVESVAMNLVDLVKRKDRCLLEVPAGVEPCVHQCGGQAMHALRLPLRGTLRIGELLAFDEMRAPPRWIGWAATVDRGAVGRTALRLAVDLGPGTRIVEVAACRFDGGDAGRWQPLRCEWPLPLRSAGDAHLLLEATGGGDRSGGGAIVLGVADVVDLRAPVLALATGNGVEIGPGMNPQVRPSRGVQVRYLEQHSVEEWARIYPKQQLDDVPKQVRALWQHYITGNAQQLDPIADGSLDFVFSSHVFEHLVNPLGTLAAWKRKLRAGGRVLGITPDAHNCFDLRQPLSRPEAWRAERDAGVWTCDDRHYERWVRYTEPRTTVQSLKERGYSVHVHFYTPATFAQLLDAAVRDLGYRSFDVRSTPNHKDFAWALYT